MLGNHAAHGNAEDVRTADAQLVDKFSGVSVVGMQDGETVFTTEAMTEAAFIKQAEGKCSFIRIL